MITKFSTQNFKPFQEKLTLDFTKTGNYAFHPEAVKGGIVNKAILYGFNGCGKSNLGLAMMDIVATLTDKNINEQLYTPYLNLDSNPPQNATFSYEFRFDKDTILYEYQKMDLSKMVYERLAFNDKTVLEYDHQQHKGAVFLQGTEAMKLEAPDSPISRVKYIRGNAILTDEKEKTLFTKFINFVEHMLLFYSLDNNCYLGFKNGRGSVTHAIIKAGKTKEFEAFLRKNNVHMTLSEVEIDGEKEMVARYESAEVSFFRVASKGTQALALFYYWYIQMQTASFVFMDEFDAFYHFELAENIVQLMRDLKDTQVLLTTHNTDLLSNDLLRPDCYFLMNENHISALPDLTDKELRQAHNLQKMFKAGAFSEKQK